MYQSPFILISAGLLPDALEDRVALVALEKRKILAEFELAGSTTIIVRGCTLHRQEVLDLLDEILHPERFPYHQALAEDKALLAFLEEGRADERAPWLDNPLYRGRAFRRFISPYYAAACNEATRRALQNSYHIRNLRDLIGNKAPLIPTDATGVYQYALRFFTDKEQELRDIRHRAETGAIVSAAEIGALCSEAQVPILNQLPDVFADIRLNLANGLNDLCVCYDRMQMNPQALAAIELAATIEIEDPELRRIIPQNLQLIRKKRATVFPDPPAPPVMVLRKSRPGLRLWLIIIGGIFLGILIAVSRQGGRSTKRTVGMVSAERADDRHLSGDRHATFQSLLMALSKPSMDSGNTENAGQAGHRLIAPAVPGDDPFRSLFNEILPAIDEVAVSDGLSAVVISNVSVWDAVVIYYAGKENRYGSAFVPSGGTFRLEIAANEYGLYVYAGRRWNNRVAYQCTEQDTRYASGYSVELRTIRGGFSERPVNDIPQNGAKMYYHPAQDGGRSVAELTINNSGEGIRTEYQSGLKPGS